MPPSGSYDMFEGSLGFRGWKPRREKSGDLGERRDIESGLCMGEPLYAEAARISEMVMRLDLCCGWLPKRMGIRGS